MAFTTGSFQHSPSSPDHDQGASDNDLQVRYQAVIRHEVLPWTTNYRKLRRLGIGGQGIVYLSERCGTDGFVRPVALKIFSPAPYPEPRRTSSSFRSSLRFFVQELLLSSAGESQELRAGTVLPLSPTPRLPAVQSLS